jgi:RNA polymerase sigma-70 factor (ECF subfamily)
MGYDLRLSPMPWDPSRPRSAPDGNLRADATFELLARAHDGDQDALEVLFARYLPRLHRWASGRLPRWARHSIETQDLVQETLLQTFKQIGKFEPQREGAFQAYLRQAVMNRIRDELRKFARRPSATIADEGLPSDEPSPLESAIGTETFERYEAALMRLRDIEREALVARVEMECTYEEMAAMLDLPSADAARKTAQRALVKLAREMNSL